MDWLGKIIQKYVKPNDVVLDLGCGIMKSTTDILEIIDRDKYSSFTRKKRKIIHLLQNSPKIIQCKSLLGCDIWPKYLDVSKRYFPVLKLGMTELDRFMDDSFDVVLCIDVLEHLTLDDAISAVNHMKRITRNIVIIYTPSKFETNEEHVENVWNLGENKFQRHQCFLNQDLLKELGFKISFPEPDKNTLAIFKKID
ncbi:MAG: class I SAM-dependent methyltransferase [Nitrosopumilus sp.]|nr:class I SAM-dependent methyltransferase [Nitrosopumilus sp.]